MVWAGAYRAERVITDSQTVRQKLAASGIARDHIDVVFPGIKRPRALIHEVTNDINKELRSEDRQVALTVGTNVPHKNLRRLIKAIAHIPSAMRPVFVFAGGNTESDQLRTLANAAGVESDIRFLGRVSDDALESLYSLSSFVVLPTLHEGFGLPTVEAMARSVPVVCSNLEIMKEVAGDAALYFDPVQEKEMAAAIQRIATEPQLSSLLSTRGQERAKAFTWQAAAEQTHATYLRAMRFQS
jgi:glycosyltransferase involved in cell wall biosynthesis